MLPMIGPFGVFEFFSYVCFSLGFLIGTFEQLLHPAAFKARELRLFRNHTVKSFYDRFLFMLAFLSGVFLLLHFIFEQMHVYQLFLYVIVFVYLAIMGLVFTSRRFSHWMYTTAARKTVHEYVVAGYARIIFLIMLLASPFIAQLIWGVA